MQIRQFEQRDMNSVLQLANAYAFFDGPTREEDLVVTHSFPEGFIVAEDNDSIVGFVYGYFKDVPEAVLNNWKASKVATIELLAVNSECQRKGVGTQLLEKLLEILKNAGADLLLLTCPVQAESAKQLYEKFGFKVSAYHMRMKL